MPARTRWQCVFNRSFTYALHLRLPKELAVSDNRHMERDDLYQLICDVQDDLLARGAFDDAQRRRRLASAGRRERKRVRLSQQEIARRMGTVQSAVSALEAGNADPQVSTLQRWARALGRRADIALVDPRMPVFDESSSKVLWHLVERKSVKSVLWTLLTRHESEAATVHSLAKLTEIPTAAMEFILENLMCDGWIVYGPKEGQIALRFERVWVAGVHIKSNEIRFAVTDLNLLTVYYSECNHMLTNSPSCAVSVIAEMMIRARDHAKRAGVKLLGVGVVLAGIVEPVTGNVIFAPDLKDSWTSIPLQGMLQEKIDPDLAVVVENDANALATREYLRNGDDHIIVLLISRGVGGSILVNGKPLHGAESAGGELGHITVEPEGKACRCGRDGCLETVVSEDALIQRISELVNRQFDTLADVYSVLPNDKRVLRAYRQAGHSLGAVLASVVAGSNPRQIIIYGPDEITDLAKTSADSFFDGVCDGLSRQRFVKSGDVIKGRSLQGDVQTIAAAGALTREFLNSPWTWVPSILTSDSSAVAT
jgi:predicted NBD/HSP70 family sugar kinase/transcriptional regulator with XRE-family HTH domain